MMMPRFSQKHLHIAGVGIIVVFATGMSIFNHINSNKPLIKAARTTAHLQQIVTSMSDSLGQTTPSGRVAHSYLISLGAISRDCQTIADSQKRLVADEAPVVSRNLVGDTRSLCDDLTKLVDDSSRSYRATLPLLTIKAQVKRYQTLPLISNLVENDHRDRIQTSLEALGENAPSDPGFPSDIKQLVEQLRVQQVSHKGLSYMPLLGTTQQQILAERQNYWASYGSIHDLMRELDVQYERYCQLLELDVHSVCQEQSN